MGNTASFKIEISKVQDFGNFELSPMYLFGDDSLHTNRQFFSQEDIFLG